MVPLIRKCARFTIAPFGAAHKFADILHRFYPVRRFRTYDPVIGNDVLRSNDFCHRYAFKTQKAGFTTGLLCFIGAQ